MNISCRKTSRNFSPGNLGRRGAGQSILSNIVSPATRASSEFPLILFPGFPTSPRLRRTSHTRLRTCAPCGAVPNDEWRISSVELIPHSAFVIPQWHSRSYPPSPRLPPSLKLWRTSRRDRAIAVENHSFVVHSLHTDHRGEIGDPHTDNSLQSQWHPFTRSIFDRQFSISSVCPQFSFFALVPNDRYCVLFDYLK